MTRQNIIISRINARGSIQASLGPADANKIVKTAATGKLHASVLPPDIEYALIGENIITPEMLNDVSFQDAELFIMEDLFDSGEPYRKYTAFADNQEIKLVKQIRVNDDNIILKPTSHSIKYKFSHNDPGNLDMTTELYKNNVLIQSNPVTVSLIWNEESYTRVDPGGNPVVFDNGDWLMVIIHITGDTAQNIWLHNLNVGFTLGS